MGAVTLFSPAKINLFLAVVGRRPDGFHELVSVAAPLEFGDTLSAETLSGSDLRLRCEFPGLPIDDTNLVLKAARAFRAATGWAQGVQFTLEKRIPLGAGLGGGSSNAASALRALNELAGSPLAAPELSALAAHIGSDCPLFLESGPVILRGRGERITPLPASAAARLRGRRVCLFKPSVAIATPWAYAQMAARGRYVPPAEAEERLAAWLDDPHRPAEDLLFNSLESVAFKKFIVLPALLEPLSVTFSTRATMSGSGSACFLWVDEAWTQDRRDQVRGQVQDAWGAAAWLGEFRLR